MTLPPRSLPLRPHRLAAAMPTASLLAALALAASPALAQLKVGSNPTSINTNANLQVEPSNGAQFLIRKDTGHVGIGTTSPQNLLHVNSGSTNTSGVQIEQVKNASVLGTDGSGNVVNNANLNIGTVKVGNTTNGIDANANLQVESTSGQQLFVDKTSGNVGIGTTSPGARLHVDSGTENTSGVRISRVTDAKLLGTNSDGDIIPVSSTAAACTCGDIKAGLQTANHGSWKLLNGTRYTCGNIDTSANTTSANTYLASGGTLGSVSGENTKTIARSQLPNVRLFTVTKGASLNILPSDVGLVGGPFVAHRSNYPGDYNSYYILAGTTAEPDAGETSSLNGNVTQGALDIRPRSLSVNYFVCIN